ncbi:uncharacterized protein LOC110678833 [Aedes aegypti]|uniref:Uncharacterized protein n=1 Tax=Aedes aegypti TaxID=7159 RepID=A0A6I8U7G8_AEDAE|nr:uncharacterized protein LOC110678833 [Aedes aegypti]XP_021708002.1 uncharacterized protein LOC110678833 [Aedes aegypti]
MNYIFVWILVLLLNTLDHGIEAKYIVDVSPIIECDNGAPFISVDLDNFNAINQEDDGDLFYNGSITFLKVFRSPWKFRLTSKRLERGTWQPGMVSKEYPDLCTAMKNPFETGLYKVTQKITKNCPFEAGYVQIFDMVDIGTFGMDIPPSFAGEWKFYVDMWIPRGFRVDHECYAFPATILEA